MRKIIFLDVDGTLVDYHNRIPESAIRAIRQARENGHLVYVCTGRSRAEMQPELWEIGLDGMIGGNGSYVEHQDQVIMHQLLSEEDSRAIVDWLHERGLEFYLESNNGLFASENFRERARETLRIYSMNKGKTAEEVADQEVEDVIHGMILMVNSTAMTSTKSVLCSIPTRTTWIPSKPFRNWSQTPGEVAESQLSLVTWG